MKETYLQDKIRELNYKIKQQMDLANQLNQQLNTIQTELKQHKHLITQLKTFETFNKDIRHDLTHLINTQQQKAVEKTQKTLKKELDGKITTLKQTLQQYQPIDHTKELTEIKHTLKNVNETTQYTHNLLNLIIERLVTERLLAKDQATILQKRAQIRTKQQDNKQK